jgi:FMN-dependent oxidoreductase (nitrilotriacetate monooxygenase family)
VTRHAHFNLFMTETGYHQASWTVSPVDPARLVSLDHHAEIARTAERGILDSLFFADAPGIDLFRTRFMVQAGFDPIDLLCALVPHTEHIGLFATASTTYGAPWDVARRFATLDHLSKGRAGWNIVTTGTPVAAANFSDAPHGEHEDRYRRAHEFVEAVLKVWDGWEDDAVIASSVTGRWADPAKLHPPHPRGDYFSVAGILPFPRSPQGYPILAQAGSSPDGVDLAGRFADVVFTPQSDIASGAVFRQRIKANAAAQGRDPDSVRTLPGLSFVLGSTHAEAQAGWDQLEAGTSEEFRLLNLTWIAGVDEKWTSDVDPDGPFPYELFDHATSATFGEAVKRVAREGNLTFRQTAHHFSTLPGGLHHTGTPESLADLIEQWWRAGGADGFTLQPLRIPRDLELFVDHVIPLLQARGVARREYGPGTTRDQLGLRRPVNRNIG